MPGNALPIARSWRPRPGQNLPIDTLAPQFEPERHQLYYDLLERAIDAEGVRNVALTGAYGTGKSSVLEHLDQERDARVVKLSLSTIAPEVHDRGTGTTEEGPGDSHARTNQIQKEIVKQLLYRLPPGRVPHSRFRRVSVPDERRDRWIAVSAGGAVFAFLFGLGLLQRVVESLLPAVWRQVLAYPLLLALSVALAWTVIVIVRARPSVSASVKAGAATVTLSKQSESYFDEYLDEIVYFFQASRRDIVVIEDIDRFEDVHVFDTLRALNGLLNNSDQIGRRIVFVYAIRDSVFEQIGATPRSDDQESNSTPVDHAKATLERANRTKFFDVIIPVVPFVSADNARDVMTDVMTSADFEIDPALIRLAARHVADMRLIRNIRNEFEVYRNRLVVTDDHLPGIDDDLVFAIVLYKNTHLADFEKIRHRESSLDQLYAIWRGLVRQNLNARASELARLRLDSHLAATTAARAARLGRLLKAFADTLLVSAQAGSASATVSLTAPATDDNLLQAQTWAQIADGEEQLITLHDPARFRTPPITLSFSAEQLSGLLGTTIDKDDWDTSDVEALTKKIATSEAVRRFLRHHTWQDLCSRRDLHVDTSGFGLTDATGEPLEGKHTFEEALGTVLHSDLARDLVRHGFLTSHFALYASSYYGNHLGRDAIEYIRRCIEPGEPDPTFTLSELDVEQILREQDADKKDDAALFSDASIFNVSIVDYLLERRLGAAANVSRHLARLAATDTSFLDLYVQHGRRPGLLLSLMAPHWSGVLRYAGVSAPLDPAARPPLLNEILRSLTHDDFDVDPQLGQVFGDTFREIDAVCRPESPDHARTVLGLVRASGAHLESLEPLNATARGVAIEFRMYPLTEENLRVIVGDDEQIALDVLSMNTHAYQYALDRLADFLLLVDENREIKTIKQHQRFVDVLNDVAELNDPAILDSFVDRCDQGFRAPDLAAAVPAAWPSLAAARRTNPTWGNTTRYVELHGIDRHIAAVLTKARKITGADGQALEERKALAVTILNANTSIPSAATRVSLAASLKPGAVTASDLEPERTDIVARLLRRRLVADDSSTFSAGIVADWTSHEAAIAASKRYPTFVSPEILPLDVLAKFIRSTVIDQSAQLAVVSQLPGYITGANFRQTRGIADALIATGWRVPRTTIEAVRTAGATSTQIVELMLARGDALSVDDVKTLLRALGGEYQRVAEGGRGRPTFSVSSAHQYLLDRLVGDTVRQVEERTFKGKGRRLTAHLR